MDSQIDMVFPDDVVLQILTRLPIKSLFRFKSVCKLWYILISDKYFVQLYNETSIQNPILLAEVTETSVSKPSLVCVDYHHGVSEFSLDFMRDKVKVRASCNGLLCCSSVPERGVYYVCNPITREFKILPKTRERPVTRFYPHGEAILVGLAGNLSSKKYSVVLAGYHRLFSHRPDNRFICLIFDSELNKWRKFISFQDDHFSHMNRNQGVYVNGALHWLTGNYSCILVLNLNCNVWKNLLLPDEIIYGSGFRLYLLELDGCVSLIQISNVWMNIWVLKDYETEEWDMVDKVSLRCIKTLVPGIYPISQGSEYVFLATHRQVLVYHRSTRVWKEMYAVKNCATLPLWFAAHSFRSTMVSCH